MRPSDPNPYASGQVTGSYGSIWVTLLLLASVIASCGDVQVDATSWAAPADAGPPLTNQFTDPFDAFDSALWTCEGSCPTASNGLLTFSLLPDVEPDNAGSWSKIRFVPRRFTSGSFTVTFALGPRPTESVYWGIALWDPGPNADQSQYNEINLGCTTDASSTDASLDLVSARLGQQASIRVDAGRNLYDGSFHIAAVVYDSARVEFYLDDEVLGTITDPSVIPTDPLSLILGTRLVTTPVLTSRFDLIIDSCEIEW